MFAALTKTLPVAVPTPEVGVVKNNVGAVGYPLPGEVSVTVPIPASSVTNNAVAAAPTPYDVEPIPVSYTHLRAHET